MYLVRSPLFQSSKQSYDRHFVSDPMGFADHVVLLVRRLALSGVNRWADLRREVHRRDCRRQFTLA